MRDFLALILLAGACCIVLSQEAKGDINTITDVSYYEPTNSIFAWAEVVPDYDTLAYYCFDDWGYVRNNDDVVDSFWGGSCDGESYYQGFFPYDPNVDYSIEVYPSLIAKIRHDIGDTYEDYYNYIEWASGDPVNYPNYFGFTGPGPDVQINGSSILLGAVYSLFTEGGLAGQPDHVKVVSDSGQTKHFATCGFTIRLLEYQAVDSSGRRVSRGPITTRERFYTPDSPNWEIGGMWSTCTPDWVTPGGCRLGDWGGKWPDTLYAGNDSNCTAPCGADPFIQKWIWCPRGKPPKVLTTNTLHITNQSILINGNQIFTPGTPLY